MEIKPTYLFKFKPNHITYPFLDDQHYGLLLPFKVKEKIYLVDTYHISHYGNFNSFITMLEEKWEKPSSYIPYVGDYYYQHCYVVTEDNINLKFDFVLDLKEVMVSSREEIHNYSNEDTFSQISLWNSCQYGTHGYYLVKKDAKINYAKKISYICSTIIEGSKPIPHIYNCDYYKLKNSITKAEADGAEYDKEEVERCYKFIDLIQRLEKEFNEGYDEIYHTQL